MNIELHGLVEQTNEEYHSGDGVSKSHLDVVAKSPLHYWSKYLDPNREPEAPTAAMILGTATHSAVLEPDLFPSQFTHMPEGLDRRTKVGKEAYEALQESGKTILSLEDYQLCLAMRDAVHAHPIAKSLFQDGKAEQSFYCTETETGELVKCRPDWITGNGVLVDLKTTDDASPDGFAKSAANFRYYVQAPYYMDILERLYGEAPPYFIFAAVEKKRPHAVAVYFVDNDEMALGRAQYMKDLQRISECKSAQQWPGYSDQIEALRLPKWLKTAV